MSASAARAEWKPSSTDPSLLIDTVTDGTAVYSSRYRSATTGRSTLITREDDLRYVRSAPRRARHIVP